MLDIGFTNVKMWFQPMNYIFETFDDFFKTMFGQPTTAAKLQSLTPEKLEALIIDAKECYQKRIHEAFDPKHFENMIIIAQKP